MSSVHFCRFELCLAHILSARGARHVNADELVNHPLNTFQGLSKLTRLDLSSNKIVSIDRNALVNLNELEKVCLYDNPISNLFPTYINGICATNIKCKVSLSINCSF